MPHPNPFTSCSASGIVVHSPMADLFDPSPSSSPPQPPPPDTALNFTLESDDISSLLHTLLQNSSQPSTSCAPAHHQQPPLPAPEDRFVFARSAGYQAGMLDSPSSLNFRFSGGFYSSGANELAENAFSSSIGLSMEGIGEVECESEDQLEVPANPTPVRSSSKRSRAAEVHNLSEKRRRQRINEKMKALQKLIPNSNKTDKASMLDEAIEYLKQLQLEVQEILHQLPSKLTARSRTCTFSHKGYYYYCRLRPTVKMLTLRNGSGLHPFYLPGISQPVQSPQMGSLLDETSGSKGVGVFPGSQEASVRAMSGLSGKPASSDYKILMPRTSENCNSGPLFVMEPSTNAHYRPFNAPMPSKNVEGPCKDPALPELHLEMNQGQSSSSGLSL